MDRTKAVAALIVLLALGGCAPSGSTRPIRIGSKNFTEQVILGEIIAQYLERRLHLPVERRLNLGGTLLAHQALRNGEIDLYPEYTGTALAAILKESVTSGPSDVLARVRSAYLRDFQIEWLDPIGIDNGFALVVRGSDARGRKIESLSDAARANDGWILGAGYEFEQRADGLPALNKTYGLRWRGRPKIMDLGLLYKALDQGQVTMIAANATDGLLSKLDLQALRDDKHAFPPYEVAIAVRRDSMLRTPGLREALLGLSGKITNSAMQALNYKADGEHRSVADVAKEFLDTSGLR
ncbi:MAG: ABC transporter substrate-binding protein [Bryobacterales bacterium]|nr:ABC transporter substrate-binding protein [Bryobacterales bacterium]